MPTSTLPASPSTDPRLVLLGPQRHQQTVVDAVRSFRNAAKGAPVAIVSAGWEERELEHEEFEQHVGVRAINLELYHGIENIYTRDPGFREIMLERQERGMALQEIYRARLAHGLSAARELLVREGPDWLLAPEREAAIEAVRAIDAHHLRRLRELHEEFRERHRPREHPLVKRFREHLALRLKDCSVLCIAGGHVRILLNRLRVSGLIRMWGDRPIVAWSAGSMVLTERVVLFHDSPPQGAGNAEILEPGFGIAPGIVSLPHANHRLALDQAARVQLLAARFAPATCVALDGGSRFELRQDGCWVAGVGTRTLRADGHVADAHSADSHSAGTDA